MLTLNIRTSGNLSTTSVVFWALEDLVCLVYLQFTMRQHWSVWLIYVADFMMATVLVTLILYFDYFLKQPLHQPTMEEASLLGESADRSDSGSMAELTTGRPSGALRGRDDRLGRQEWLKGSAVGMLPMRAK